MKFKTFLIDAHKCEIREIEISGELEDYYKHIGCDMIQHVPSYTKGLPDLYVDEEGLWNQTGLWWIYNGFPQPLVGNAIAIGTDDEGETIAPEVTLEKLQEAVRFVDLAKINGKVMAFPREALKEADVHQGEFEKLVGKTIKEIIGAKDGSDEIRLITDAGTLILYHSRDCCESVYVEDVSGDLEDLINTPILVAEERTSTEPPEGAEVWEVDDWTFYTLRTIKGTVDIRWHGSSNGYYSTSVDLRWD